MDTFGLARGIWKLITSGNWPPGRGHHEGGGGLHFLLYLGFICLDMYKPGIAGSMAFPGRRRPGMVLVRSGKGWVGCGLVTAEEGGEKKKRRGKWRSCVNILRPQKWRVGKNLQSSCSACCRSRKGPIRRTLRCTGILKVASSIFPPGKMCTARHAGASFLAFLSSCCFCPVLSCHVQRLPFESRCNAIVDLTSREQNLIHGKRPEFRPVSEILGDAA